ncbi:MAG: Fic family protein [Lachnospiraceae bacterium]|nr:Fic family protein [Lachnospiraceae bacterium]
MIVKDVYNMTQEENIFCAKRTLIDSIYQQANLEGIGVTFAETQDIINNVNVESINPKDISKVCCLRDGWKYLFENLSNDLNLIFLEDIHNLIARFDVDYRYLGKIRKDEVMISGTSWRPIVPTEQDIDALCVKLKDIDKNNITDSAIDIGLYIMRMQPFKDGNKRVGSYAINKILIENGKGIFNVPVELDGTFKQKLVDYYVSDDNSELKEFISEKCLNGTTKA